MGSDRRAFRLAAQVAALTVTSLGLAALLAFTEARVAALLAAAAIVAQAWALHRSSLAGERATARFVATVGAGDYNQNVTAAFGDSKLGAAFAAALDRLRETVAARDGERLALRAIVEHAPTPLVAVNPDGTAELLNVAARRLFDRAQIGDLADVAVFDSDLAAAMEDIEPGERNLVRARRNDRELRLALSATSVTERGVRRRVIALQNIDSELGAAEFDAWRDLVRVLTHEIMNTLTPITSLTETSRDLTQELARRLATAERDAAVIDLANDARDAGEAAYRRAAGLKTFVETYRQIARVPKPILARVAAKDVLARARAVFAADRPGIDVTIASRPDRLAVDVDSDLLEQAFINLLANAADANTEAGSAIPIALEAALDGSGDVVFSVKDHGLGVAPEHRERIFTPFFTTKPNGTGVGLAVVRQIALAHGGRATYAPATPSGSVFGIRIPMS